MNTLDNDVLEVADDRTNQIEKACKKRLKSGVKIVVSKEAAMQLFQRKCGGATLRILWWMIGNLEADNLVKTTQEKIGEAMGMKKTNVSRAMKPLQESRLIEKVGHGEWRLNLSGVSGFEYSKVLQAASMRPT